MAWDQGTDRNEWQSATRTRRAWGPGFPSQVTLATTSGTAYWMFIGVAPEDIVWNYVRGHITTGGTGAQTAELAIASSPLVPNRSSQVLTCLWASGSVTDLTASGVVLGNNSAAALRIARGTPVWLGIRTAMASTQPTIRAAALDIGQGALLTTAASGVLTTGNTYTGATSASSASAQGPWLMLTVD